MNQKIRTRSQLVCKVAVAGFTGVNNKVAPTVREVPSSSVTETQYENQGRGPSGVISWARDPPSVDPIYIYILFVGHRIYSLWRQYRLMLPKFSDGYSFQANKQHAICHIFR